MRYRKLTATGDYSFGRGLADFWIDCPEAVAQAVSTRLKLWQKTWFLDRTAGMPWDTKVFGFFTGSTRDPAIRACIASTKGVLDLYQYNSSLDRDTRDYAVSASLLTIYGQAILDKTILASQPQ
jgi:hypothetical protein